MTLLPGPAVAHRRSLRLSLLSRLCGTVSVFILVFSFAGIFYYNAFCYVKNGGETPKTARLQLLGDHHQSKSQTVSELTPISPSLLPDTEHLSLEALRELVSSTEGFLARDYSLNLGWNNIRYIIEAALLQAKLLRRTLILPSFIYARGCEYDVDALGSNEWRELPIEEQMGWVFPINLMINITHLRENHPVITVSDYLRLHGIDPATEASNGEWQRDRYHASDVKNVFTGKTPELYVIQNEWYDQEIMRVDKIPEEIKARKREDEAGGAHATLEDDLPQNVALDWDRTQEMVNIWDDHELERVMIEHGWEVLHTFKPVKGLELSKAVTEPMKQFARRSAIRGFQDDFSGRKEEVLLLSGPLHHHRKPGGMRFTTRLALNEYLHLVLHDIRQIDAVISLADLMVQRMYDLVGGRLWMAAHMRRGDFVRYNFVMENTPERHIDRVKQHLVNGRRLIESLHERQEVLQTYDMPDTPGPNYEMYSRGPPLSDDWFYVATDERNATILQEFRNQGAVFMDDLLTISDRRMINPEISWALMITDFRGLIEQIVLSRAAYFYGHMMSSVVGGVMNLRGKRGVDPRTTDVD
ncbi:uncharacterized protein EV420DRAFT_1619149 [Desarmillaria tabescens]|uniref:Uncharacterized protein n=1 Tax=Armillaria tabescens TaxID=1929756 RepID=A0AA39NBM6_ARMTA|nr:uncharacterized protein EV420DRAFT_1619149 [Desarmillaria tabescens]KAK0462652.1 hypothetical protein EV420DRAFT_1619149 [Desarmillaria tabescens]